MKTFPIHALSRPYTQGYPRPVTIDSGVAAMQLGNGALRTRDELGQAIEAHELRIEGLTGADAGLLRDFYSAHRAATFYWADPEDYATYESRFDPGTPPVIVPAADLPGRHDATIRLLPVVPTAAIDALLVHYKLNENAADTDVADATGNGHDGTASHNTSTLSVTGKITTALQFVSASSRYVQVSDHADLHLTDGGTVCFWVKWDGTRVSTGGASSTIISRNTYWRIWLASADGQIGLITSTGAANQARSTAGILTASTWQHVAVVWDPTAATRRFFVDGVEETGDNGDRSMPADTTADLHLGSYSAAAGFFGGDLDDVRIYKRPLTLSEIKAIYNEGSGTEEAIVA